MDSSLDYSRFDSIGVKEYEDDVAKEREKKKKYAKSVASRGGRLFKYVDSDGETVSDDDEDHKAMMNDMMFGDYGTGTIRDNELGANDDEEEEEEEELHPLFWTRMPKEGEKGSELAKAIDDMVYKNEDDEDKTPNDLAEDFKEKGNEFYRWGKKFYKRALSEYKEALRWARKGDGSESNRQCYAAILSNRAAIQLKFKNYGSVLRDCKAAIQYGPSPLPNCKTYYRAAIACNELGRLREAKEFLAKGIRLDSSNEALIDLNEKVTKRLQEQKQAELARDRADLEERRKDEKMRKECVSRGFKVGALLNDIEPYLAFYVGNRTQGGFPRPTYNDGSMQWPVLLMIPGVNQTDFIQSFDLSHRFVDHLMMMFPATKGELPSPKQPHWDEKGEYTLDALELYFEERQSESFNMSKMWAPQYRRKSEKEDYTKKMRIKVGLERTLNEVLVDDRYIVPGVVTIYLVSNRTDYFRDTFTPQHAGRLRIL